ncbi:MAG TPA: GNAT family N-acetyltransferase [Aggregatilinea sp.]|jgi:ribosomal protein S18 acetylase RimI-like enzyme|uniref:GNAT family N-acetyltransferase n=1 Tax=Aggregatilinea sp. TaxID=2806333 RepID=UPI002C9649DB|nr:GNAT family N-acetyltransferase [Aggregatilinea sp.]HML20446.1 GNAT family N-acetyltransferase [Aggregatilinea sp.]
MLPSELETPTLSLFIRPAQPADADALIQTCWRDRTLSTAADMLRRTEKMASHHRGLALVAICDGAPCGFGLLTLWPRAGEISDLIVTAKLRGRGVGTRLVQALSDAAAELGVRTLEIGAALSNPRALALYRRLGFKDARTIELDLGCGLEPVVYLTKALPKG